MDKKPDIQTALTLIDFAGRKNVAINLTSRQREVVDKGRYAMVVKFYLEGSCRKTFQKCCVMFFKKCWVINGSRKKEVVKV